MLSFHYTCLPGAWIGPQQLSTNWQNVTFTVSKNDQ